MAAGTRFRKNASPGADCSYRVAPQHQSEDEYGSLLVRRMHVGSRRSSAVLRVALDFAYDQHMDHRELYSLAKQISLIQGMRKATSLGVDLALCSLGGTGDGALPLLRTRGLDGWDVRWKTAPPTALDGGARRVTYLSPDASATLTDLEDSTCYVIGALVDRRRPARNASLDRAASLGVEAVRLPILEHLPHLRQQSHGAVKLNRLNVTAVFASLLRFAACRDWGTALQMALGDHQRHTSSRRQEGAGSRAAGEGRRAVGSHDRVSHGP